MILVNFLFVNPIKENKTNAFEKASRLPGIKHPSIVDGKHNSSVSGSQDESEGESHMPLPPIKQMPSIYKGEGVKVPSKKPPGPEKYGTLKGEYSHQSLGNKVLKTKKKFHEDLKIDKAKIFKKGLSEVPKMGKKKKYPGA